MLKEWIDAAAKRKKASLVLKNGSYADVFCGVVRKGDIAIENGRIVGIGNYDGEEEIDVSGKVVLPSFIDGHIHIESTQLSPEEFARLTVPHGTGTIIADPHEITNVCGIQGTEYIAEASRNLPLDVVIQLPSCVPSTAFETSGCVINGAETAEYLQRDYIHGLAEMMNYPGVINADPDTLQKLEAALAKGECIDGHAPGLQGDLLNAYLCSGVATDHECVTPEECLEKISKGMYVHLRLGSSTNNIVNKFPAVNAATMRRFLLCTDDKHAVDLMERGHVDDILRLCVANGMDPMWAVTMCTLNPAECYNLKYKGAIAPFYHADVAVVDDLRNFTVRYVFKGGKLVAKDGEALFDTKRRYLPETVLHAVHLKRPLEPSDFVLRLKGDKAHTIGVMEGEVFTKDEVVSVRSENGDVVCENDVLKLAVVERHHGTGNIGLGLLKGIGLAGGAVGITVAHDSHNIILLGDNNADMAAAGNRLAEIGGGMVVCSHGHCDSVQLDIAGLMSSEDAPVHAANSAKLMEKVYALGVDRKYDAFLTLAFMSLAVIPEIKLTDMGLFDVRTFSFMDINA